MVAVFSLHQPREPGESFRAAIRCANDADGRPHNQQGRVRGLWNRSRVGGSAARIHVVGEIAQRERAVWIDCGRCLRWIVRRISRDLDSSS